MGRSDNSGASESNGSLSKQAESDNDEDDDDPEEGDSESESGAEEAQGIIDILMEIVEQVEEDAGRDFCPPYHRSGQHVAEEAMQAIHAIIADRAESMPSPCPAAVACAWVLGWVYRRPLHRCVFVTSHPRLRRVRARPRPTEVWLLR